MSDTYIIHKDRLWTKHGSYLYAPFPGARIDSNCLHGLKENYFFARLSYDFDLEKETDWWFIIKDQKEDLNDYKSNHRNQIRKGLKTFTCKKIDLNEILDSAYSVYKSCMINYQMSSMTYEDYCNSVDVESAQNIEIEYFGVFKDEVLAGYGKNLIDKSGSFVFYENIYINKEFRNLYPNYCLLHTMNTEYLNNREFNFVSDGTRTLLHPTGIQDFLEKKFLFRKAYCRLHVFYSKRVKITLPILSFLDKVLGGLISEKQPKIKALLVQHKIHNASLHI
jgi:hypothetical protein